VAALAAASWPVLAQTLYKLVDKNGKVTYSESKPKPGEFDGEVIEMNIDKKANTATMPKFTPSPAPASSSSSGRSASVDAARERLEAAKKALAQAQENPTSEELRFIANKGGGTRPVPSDEYKAKLEKLEADVKAAEEEVRRAEAR
jgi:hypothetical protein